MERRPECRCHEREEGLRVYCPRHKTYNLPEPTCELVPYQIPVVRMDNLNQCGGGRQVIRREIGRT